jgi:hypothetical protein
MSEMTIRFVINYGLLKRATVQFISTKICRNELRGRPFSNDDGQAFRYLFLGQ